MDFGLSEEQEMLVSSAREFFARECPPQLVRIAAESESGVADGFDRMVAAMGWPGLLVPEAHGGLGLGMLEAALLLAEFGRAAAPGSFYASSVLAVRALTLAGSAAQKKRWLAKLAAGEMTATLAWLEASDRWDPAGIAVRARRVRGGFEVSGTKLFVPGAATADLLLLPARTSGATGAAGISLLAVERAAPGVTIRPLESIDRTRRVDEVELREVAVDGDEVIGKVGGAWPTLARLFDLGALALAADALGGSERVLEMAVDYAKTREQFGRPIGSFQAVKHMAAEIVADVEPARSLLWYAAYALDEAPREASRAVSMAKARLSEVYAQAAHKAVQIHGGIGFTWAHDVHFWFKRAKWDELAFGDPALHRERIAAAGF